MFKKPFKFKTNVLSCNRVYQVLSGGKPSLLVADCSCHISVPLSVSQMFDNFTFFGNCINMRPFLGFQQLQKTQNTHLKLLFYVFLTAAWVNIYKMFKKPKEKQLNLKLILSQLWPHLPGSKWVLTSIVSPLGAEYHSQYFWSPRNLTYLLCFGNCIKISYCCNFCSNSSLTLY